MPVLQTASQCMLTASTIFKCSGSIIHFSMYYMDTWVFTSIPLLNRWLVDGV